MKKIIERTIEEGYSGNVKHYARTVMGISSNLLKRIKMQDGIRVNGVSEYVIKELKAGDVLSLTVENGSSSQNVYARAGELDIVYEDEDILVLNKQAPLPVHPSKGHVDDSLANRVTAYFADKGESYTTRIVTRLDSGTSGLMVLAKHAFAHDRLQKQLHAGFVRKYLAVVDGTPDPPCGRVDAPIAREQGPSIRRIISNDGQLAVTDYQTVRTLGGRALVSLQLKTGRTHQIRVHMAHIGCPLVGDFLYGTESGEIARAALHSCFMELDHPITGERMSFSCPLPDDMEGLLR
ncbi:MAG: RluA family pseudouridine synthase [Clostridia bacterium]|nr:RluA family pseudouridine synthase [Clostridia bacterium]